MYTTVGISVPVTNLVWTELQMMEVQLAFCGDDVMNAVRYGDANVDVPRYVSNSIAAVLGNLTCGVDGPYTRGRWRSEYYDNLTSINSKVYTFARVERRGGEVRRGTVGDEPVRFVVDAVSPSGRVASIDLGNITGIVTAFPLKEMAASNMEEGLLPQFDICLPPEPGGKVDLSRAEVLPSLDDHSRVSSFSYLQLAASVEMLLDQEDVTVKLDGAKVKNDSARRYFRSGMMLAPVVRATFEQMRRVIPLPRQHDWRRIYTIGNLPQWDGRPPRVTFQIVSGYGDRFRKVYGGTSHYVGMSADDHPLYAVDFGRLFQPTVMDAEKSALCNLLNRLWGNEGGNSGMLRKVA